VLQECGKAKNLLNFSHAWVRFDHPDHLETLAIVVSFRSKTRKSRIHNLIDSIDDCEIGAGEGNRSLASFWCSARNIKLFNETVISITIEKLIAGSKVKRKSVASLRILRRTSAALVGKSTCAISHLFFILGNGFRCKEL